MFIKQNYGANGKQLDAASKTILLQLQQIVGRAILTFKFRKGGGVCG